MYTSNAFLFLPFHKQQILDPSKLKQFADDNFKLYENGRNVSKMSNFSFSQSVFMRFYCRHVKTRACLRKGQLFPTQVRLLTTLRDKPSENIVGKGENAGYQHFLLFPQCFLLFPK